MSASDTTDETTDPPTDRPISGRRTAPRRDPVTIAQIPHIWDGDVLLTTVQGAAALMQVGLSTVRYWDRKGWIRVKYSPSGRKHVVIESLWRDEPPVWVRAQVEAAREGARRMTAVRLARAAEGNADAADAADANADVNAPDTAPHSPHNPPSGEGEP